MSVPADFRLSKFDRGTVIACGKYIGRRSYWKLYAIENVFRVVIHSVLSVQLSSDWWNLAVDNGIRSGADRAKERYLKVARERKAGKHGVYYVGLRDLSEILRANANLFLPAIPDLDGWLLAIEKIRAPRNLVAHSNYPTEAERKHIDKLYGDCQRLLTRIEAKNVELLIP